MSRVVVIGGGVIGLSCAYHLARRGEQVTVLERTEPGSGCSSGNLGWTVPSLAEPIPAPGLTWKSIKWMLRRDSPLYIDPQFALSSSAWLLRFWRHCNPRDFHRGTEAVAAFSGSTLALFDAFRADGIQFEMHRDGILFLYLSTVALERSLAAFERVQKFGMPAPKRLDRAAALKLEPRLTNEVTGGVLIPDQGHVRPETLCAGLARRLRELGVEVLSRVEMTGAIARNGRVSGIETSAGPVAGDAFVLAAGTWSGRLAKLFGFALPIAPGKGYTVTIDRPAISPARPTYLYENRIGLTPFAGALRLGGTMELSGINSRIIPERIAAIRRGVARYLPGAERGSSQVEWMGLRPLTPDGLPAIGKAPRRDNLFVATGHAMHGVTLAPVTGMAIAELVTSAASSFDLQPFDPGRFDR